MRSKNIILWMFLPLIVTTACSKKVASDRSLETVAVALCKKIPACYPQAMPKTEKCYDMMKKTLHSGKETIKVQASQRQLDACVASIDAADCQNLLGLSLPEECGFLKK